MRYPTPDSASDNVKAKKALFEASAAASLTSGPAAPEAPTVVSGGGIRGIAARLEAEGRLKLQGSVFGIPVEADSNPPPIPRKFTTGRSRTDLVVPDCATNAENGDRLPTEVGEATAGDELAGRDKP
ncbi:hypothetical protein HK104_003443 [Borealophlyctis nickersoniae]|nr:hypothetical protein HK104_003443 [Borealophlyctis nickersoniae]